MDVHYYIMYAAGLEWRITENSRGGFDAELGIQHDDATIEQNLSYMPRGFIVYESAHYDTRTQAERAIIAKGGHLR